MKRKFTGFIYFLVVAMLIFSLSGCGSDDDNNSSSNNTVTSKLLVVNSKAFTSGDNYQIHTASNPNLAGTNVETPRYYVGPDVSDTENTLQLEFSGSLSNDTGFVITKDDGLSVVFAYNPNGTEDEVGTEDVTLGVSTGRKQMSYTSLDLSENLTGSSINSAYIGIETDDAIEIVLDSSDKSVKVNDTTLDKYDLVWHVSPDHKGEYWVYNNKEYDDEDEALTAASVDKEEGVYVAYDVRYVPDYLTFSDTTVAKSNEAGDSDQMYVSYYTVAGYEKYILAALPTEMGAATGGTPGSSMKAASKTDVVDAMTHSVSEAKKNPVVHITEEGTYKLSGTWDGQIWVDAGKNSQVVLILDGVNVNCTVAPALVFKKVYECEEYDDDDEDEVNEKIADIKANSMDVYTRLMEDIEEGETTGLNAGAVVMIANGTKNTFTGTNVARLNELEVNTDDGYTTSNVGSYVKAQKKMYKLDGAFHSRQSMVIGLADEGATGTLTISSDYEGLDSEMHMLIDSGTIVVNAKDDGINVNEDEISVFTMTGGSLTVNSTNGDGIDSNGYIIITSADKLSITAAGATKPTSTQNLNTNTEGALDADCGVYMSEEVFKIYEVNASSSSNPQENQQENQESEESSTQTYTPSTSDEITDDDGNKVATVTFNATSSEVKEATYNAETRVNTYGVAESGDKFKVLTGVNNFSGLQ